MLLFANLGMALLARRPHPDLSCQWAMFTSGNLGMLLGMWAGGRAAGLVETESLTAAAVVHFGGMTAGMIAGMLGLAALTRRLLPPTDDAEPTGAR
jgi:hypothetical protein